MCPKHWYPVQATNNKQFEKTDRLYSNFIIIIIIII